MSQQLQRLLDLSIDRCVGYAALVRQFRLRLSVEKMLHNQLAVRLSQFEQGLIQAFLDFRPLTLIRRLVG